MPPLCFVLMPFGQKKDPSGKMRDFDAAYQAEATRLIDEEGVTLDYAACSAFVFAWNNYATGEVTLSSPKDAVDYIEKNQKAAK